MNCETVGQKQALIDAQELFEYCSNNVIRKEFLKKHNKNFNYYDGKQWEDLELLKSLEDIGCDPKTFNHIKPACNDVISILIRSGKRIGYLPTEDSKTHANIADYLKSWAFNIQTQNNHTYFSNLKVLSALLSGIGWSDFKYEDNKFTYDWVDSREIYWDPGDRSVRLDNSNVICRSYFVNKIVLKNKFPDEKKHFDNLVSDTQGNLNNDVLNRNEYDLDSNTWVNGKNIRIVEVYSKKECDYYETLATIESLDDEIQQEQILQTFHKDFAEKQSLDGNVEVKKGTKIFKTVFCDDILLFNGAIEHQVPNQKHFPLLPLVFRRDLDGLPLGVVDDIISPQDMYNAIMSTILHYTDSKTLICTRPTIDKGNLSKQWELESRKKAGSLFLADAKDVQIIDNKQNVEHRLKVLAEVRSEIQSIMRVYDDFAGKQTNRTSGVAINASTTNNLNSQNFLILSYEHMLTSEGKLMLDTLKGVKDMKQVFSYYKDGTSTSAELDSTISMINFEVYPENAPNFSSTIEEEKAKFADIINSPNKDLLLNSPLFLQESGISDASSYKLHNEYKRVLLEQMQMQQGLQPQPAGEEDITEQ